MKLLKLDNLFFSLAIFVIIITCQNQRQIQFQPHVEAKYSPLKTLYKQQDSHTDFNLKHIYHVGAPESHIKTKEEGDKESTVMQKWDASNTKSYTPPFELNINKLNTLLRTHSDLSFLQENDDNEVLKVKKDVLTLARMASHAYDVLPADPWEDLSKNWTMKEPFGWKKKKIRGYIFSDEKEENMVISFKGTSPPYMPGSDGTTSPSDRDSDNLMFSCCCGKTDVGWSEVCSCSKKKGECENKCVREAAQGNVTYFNGAIKIYEDAKKKYPNANFMLVGHSLGGALASLVALKEQLVAVTFEAPPDRLYARRLDLEDPFRKPAVFHFGNNADPLFVGNCNGALSLCYLAGYGMDSKCHTGTKCVFDTKKDLGWSETLLHHTIAGVIDNLLVDWAGGAKNISISCVPKSDCKDCDGWGFV